jgi:hypothetical protein
MELSSHDLVVSEWMDRAFGERSQSEIAPIFGCALLAIWDRAHRALGEASLGAIVGRVLHAARARFPTVAVLAIRPAPESFRELAELAEHDGVACERSVLLAAIHFTLVELLSLLGTLTAGLLTPGLHDAVRAVSMERGRARLGDLSPAAGKDT